MDHSVLTVKEDKEYTTREESVQNKKERTTAML